MIIKTAREMQFAIEEIVDNIDGMTLGEAIGVLELVKINLINKIGALDE